MNFKNLGVRLLGYIALSGLFQSSQKQKMGVIKRASKTSVLDSLMTPGLVKGNAPTPSRSGKFKANQRKEIKAGEKKRTIEAHKAGAKKNKTKEKAKREKVKREKRLKKY